VWDLGAVRQISPYNSVTAGKTYHVQAWIKTSNVANPSGWYVFGIWWFRGDRMIGESKMPRQETNNYGWRLIAWDATAPAGADRGAAILSRHTDGDAWYDDIYIGQGLAGSPGSQAGDFDGDGDVDQQDLDGFLRCLTGPGLAQTDTACTAALLDADDDVDVEDWAIWENCFSGPGVKADADCGKE
jgi:hypothetical protein